MCGRARQAQAAASLLAAASKATGSGVDFVDQSAYKPQENMHPGCDAAVLTGGAGRQSRMGPSRPLDEDGEISGAPMALRMVRWGLLPPSAAACKSPRSPECRSAEPSSSTASPASQPSHWKMFNARSETVDVLGVFKRLLGHGRCVLPVDGFYEWTPDEFRAQAKQPWYVHARPGCVAGGTGLETGTLLWVAGLYDSTTRSFTLLTADAPPRLRWLHDRVPVLLDQEGIVHWIGGDDASALAAMRRCASHSALDVAWHPVTKQMSKIGYTGADCALPVKLVSQQQKSVASFFKPHAAAESSGGEEGSSGARGSGRSGGSQGRTGGTDATGVKRSRDGEAPCSSLPEEAPCSSLPEEAPCSSLPT